MIIKKVSTRLIWDETTISAWLLEQPGISQMAESGLWAWSKSCRELARNNVVAIYVHHLISIYGMGWLQDSALPQVAPFLKVTPSLRSTSTSLWKCKVGEGKGKESEIKWEMNELNVWCKGILQILETGANCLLLILATPLAYQHGQWLIVVSSQMSLVLDFLFIIYI